MVEGPGPAVLELGGRVYLENFPMDQSRRTMRAAPFKSSSPLYEMRRDKKIGVSVT